MDLTVDVIIPTYKPDEKFYSLLRQLGHQTYPYHRLIVINTEKQWIEEEKYRAVRDIEWVHIRKEEYDHGGTRSMGAELSDADIILFMTQDAVPKDEFLIENLLKPFQDEMVAVTYARQLPDKNCKVIEKYTRRFNYSNKSLVKSKEDIKTLGIKTFFCSNVCAAYRRDTYMSLGGFVKKTIFNEDMIFAGTAILKNYKVAYAAEARVVHSHNYNNFQQFERNFDLGVSQADYPEIFERVKVENEGVKLIKDTSRYLLSVKKPFMIIDLIIKSGFKFIGYKMGKSYKKLPKWLILRCTMNPSYWKSNK
jgi:rhamnosyltransferase